MVLDGHFALLSSSAEPADGSRAEMMDSPTKNMT